MSRNSFLAAGLTVVLTMSAIAQQRSTGFRNRRKKATEHVQHSVLETKRTHGLAVLQLRARGLYGQSR